MFTKLEGDSAITVQKGVFRHVDVYTMDGNLFLGHGGFVGIITGSVFLGIAETMMHWFIDDGKCRGVIDFNTDQTLHIVCKIAWAMVATLIIQFNNI